MALALESADVVKGMMRCAGVLRFWITVMPMLFCSMASVVVGKTSA